MSDFNNRDVSIYDAAIAKMKNGFVTVALFSAAVNILMLTGPMFMLQVYDRVLSSGSIATLQGLFIIVIFLYIFLWFYDFLRTRMLSRLGYALDQDVGKDGFSIWMKTGAGTTRIKGRPLNDLSVVRSFIGSPAILGIFDLPWVPFYLVIVFFIHPWLGFLALFGALVVISLALANQFMTHKSIAHAMFLDGSEGVFVDQSHRNADAILPLGMAGNILEHWQKMHRTGLAVGQKGGDRGEAFSTASKTFRLLLQSSLLALGGYLVLQQEISPGMIIASSIIAGRALAPIDQVIGQWRSVIRAREAHRRLKYVFKNVKEKDDMIDLPVPIGHLSLENVVKYPPNAPINEDIKPILSGVSFQLSPGDALGVIGPSACGKSSLARLLVGAWQPESGTVRLDGAELNQWHSDKLGKYIGYLPQRLELLAGTIKDNIARFDPMASDDDVIIAAQMAGVHEMILSLPDGYATFLGFGSQTLSGGQIQRIGLARALFGNPKLIVLDEPNSNLDTDGDSALTKAIQSLRELGSTVIVMAHRPSAISAVNKMLVLNNGQIANFGNKGDILQKMARPVAHSRNPTTTKVG